MRERWWGASGRRVPEVAIEGEAELPLAEALVLDDAADAAGLRRAFEQGTPVVVRAASAQAVKEALARPEVTCVLVPAGRRDLLELDLTELTYG